MRFNPWWLGCALVASFGSAQTRLGLHEVAPDVYVYTDGDSSGENPATTNSLIVVSPEAVLVGDGLGTEAKTRALLAAIRGVSEAPIRYLVNASWHGDHTGGNHLFDGAVIIAQREARDALLEVYASRPDSVRAPPSISYDDHLTLQVGEIEVRLLHLGRAHTAGDTVIYLPGKGVAFMSEVFFHGQFPGLRSAYPSEWLQTIDRASELEADVFIPGHGVLVDGGHMREQLLAMRAELASMILEVEALVDRGVPRDALMSHEPLRDYAKLINAERNLPIAVERIARELAGELDASSEAAIRAARARSNRAIANHDAATVASFWTEDYHVTTSRSDQTAGRASNQESFQAHFDALPDVVYQRSPVSIRHFASWRMASEHGTWRGSWTEEAGKVVIGGDYTAKWREVEGQWLIEAEIFTPTFCYGTAYCEQAP